MGKRGRRSRAYRRLTRSEWPKGTVRNDYWGLEWERRRPNRLNNSLDYFSILFCLFS